MNWKNLLSLNKHNDKKNRERLNENPTRVGFEYDYDRIIFSNAFRSLQDKTQVVPLSKTDFVHTRLTHSLEVSVVGRSLGRLVGMQLIEKYPELAKLGYTINDFGNIVASASLCHDIGNPPFGHSGEKAIGDFFKSGEGKKYQSELTEKQWQDLIDFEGNANGFHLLTKSSPGISGGLRITYATLGTFMKYPKESLPKKPTSHITDKKFGYFQADKQTFLNVANTLGLIRKSEEHISFFRHPLAYLVEAADDICYTIIDFEDGINLGWIDEQKGFDLLENLVKDRINLDNYKLLRNKSERIAYLRALAIGTLINDVTRIFMEHENELLSGKFATSLTDCCNYFEEMNSIIKISINNVYRNSEVIEKEIMGYRVIHTLLRHFIETSEAIVSKKMSHFNTSLRNLYPEVFHDLPDDLYLRLLHICSYISLLSDGKALDIYHKIKQ